MDGFEGFFSNNFELSMKYQHTFKVLFKQFLPDLESHFEQEGFIEQLWLFKWL